MRLESGDYYADRDVEHTAQGDIYADIPFIQATVTVSPELRGARKRPMPSQSDLAPLTTYVGYGIVLHYTCGFTAQPPGVSGYSHDYRLMAPIISLRTLKQWGMKNNELRKIRDGATIQGFMYLPQNNALTLDNQNSKDEWTGHAAIIVLRAMSVSQSLLDHRHRTTRLTSDATRILNAAIIQTFTPNNFDWHTLNKPDLTNSWQKP